MLSPITRQTNCRIFYPDGYKTLRIIKDIVYRRNMAELIAMYCKYSPVGNVRIILIAGQAINSCQSLKSHKYIDEYLKIQKCLQTDRVRLRRFRSPHLRQAFLLPPRRQAIRFLPSRRYGPQHNAFHSICRYRQIPHVASDAFSHRLKIFSQKSSTTEFKMRK